jgi:single-stranded-DNA-specific exonuclease
MLKWHIGERLDDSLNGHLQILRAKLDSYDYGDLPSIELYGRKIPDPFLVKDIEKVAQRIIRAIEHKEKIVIFGHDDVDGITSTYILFDFLHILGSTSHFYYIPNRFYEHHGIQQNFINYVRDNKFSLVITTDGGITSHEGVESLNEMGCEVLLTDHHLVPSVIPPAYAVVNPKQPDCRYPYDMLAGVGVAYLLLLVLAKKLNMDLPSKYLFWTAVGSIADKVPMTGVNRTICKSVIDNWKLLRDDNITIWPGYNYSGIDCFSMLAFIFTVIKIMNNGREKDGENIALYLLLAPEYKKLELLQQLIPLKKKYEEELYQAKKFVNKILPKDEDCLYYIYFDREKNLPYNLMGWAASHINSLCKVPVLIIQKRGSELSCEARCNKGFNLIKGFNHAGSALKQFGGHVQAAGFVTDEEKLNDFTKLFQEYISRVKDDIIAHKILPIDAEISESDLPDLREKTAILCPFGEEAPEPVFLIRKTTVSKVIALSKCSSAAEVEMLRNIDENPNNTNNPSEQKSFVDVVFKFRADGKLSIIDQKPSR